jgi:ATP-binding cassette subfamily B protein
MKDILKYLKPYTNKAVFGIILKAIGAVVELMLPFLISYLLDDIVPTGDLKTVTLVGCLMIAFSITSLICNITSNRIAAYVSTHFGNDLRNDLFKKIQSLDLTDIDRFSAPTLITRMTSDVDGVERMILISMRMAIRAPLLFFGGLVMTLFIDPVLTLVLLICVPIITFLVIFVSKKTVPLFKKVQMSIDNINTVLRENLSGIKVIKALSMSDYEKKRFDKHNNQLKDDNKHVQLVMAIVDPSITLTLNMGLTLVIIAGGYRVDMGIIGNGKIVAFVQYFIMIINALMALTRIFNITNRSIACARRINEVFDVELKRTFTDEEVKANSDDVKIEFDHVSFKYDGAIRNAVEDISFKLKKGQTVTFIGATGSGKTTIANLLMRFYDANEGRILIDGVDIRKYPSSQLLEKVVIALQNATIFSSSIKENIKYGRNVSDEQVIEAAKIAQADDFISKFDNGYDHILTQSGTNLSGGQRQRIAIARAVVTKPEIIIFDDTSSALDYATDARLRHALRIELSNSTFVVIAQRVSSSMHSDLIIVLDDGKIVDMGTHNELMQRCSIYQEIAASQVGGDFDAA